MMPYSNPAYHISRKFLLRALGFLAEFDDYKIPVGKSRSWHNVEVRTGWQGEGPVVVLPLVILRPSGVANRLHAKCPECGKVMRFCGLQQHVGSKTCKEKAAKRLSKIVRPVLTPTSEPLFEMDFKELPESKAPLLCQSLDPVGKGENMDYAHDRNAIK